MSFRKHFTRQMFVDCPSYQMSRCAEKQMSGHLENFIRVRVKGMQDNLTPLLTFLCARTNHVNYRRVVSIILHAHKATKLFPFAVLEKV